MIFVPLRFLFDYFSLKCLTMARKCHQIVVLLLSIAAICLLLHANTLKGNYSVIVRIFESTSKSAPSIRIEFSDGLLVLS